MTTPKTIVLLRHAEKPSDEDDHDLSPRGRERALALGELLSRPSELRPDALFATKTEPDGGGVRTQETLAPLAQRLGLPLRCPHTKRDVARLAAEVLADPALAGKVVAICWDHKNLPPLAAALGLGDAAPVEWDRDCFDRFWVVSFATGEARLREVFQPIVLGNPASASLLETPPAPFDAFVLPRAAARRAAVSFSAGSAVAADSAAGPAAQADLAHDIEAGDLPAATSADLERLLDALDAEPEAVLARVRVAFGKDLDESGLRAYLETAIRALKNPEDAAIIARREAIAFAGTVLPPEFTFDGYDPDTIPIDAASRKFEEAGDWFGWVIHTAKFVLGYAAGPKKAFHWHDDPQYPSGFVYPLRSAPGADLPIALFADFGTGLYHSRYIAKHIQAAAYPYAIHLGDVYYAGRENEFAERFRAALDPLLGATRLFTMNGNHEMFSTGRPYFRYIDDRRAHPSGLQEQEGSYFCLRGERHQIIGIDTDYFGYSRYKNFALLRWLAHQLAVGRSLGLTNILLSGDEPYEYGKSGTSALLDDLRGLVVDEPLVDLWFWGNTHYCALFTPAPGLPFVGSCIGHGGFPYGRQKPGGASAAPVAFLETGARFPAWTRIRQDRGNNGFCVMTLGATGDVALQYIDWMKHERCRVALARQADGKLVLGTPEIF